MIENLVRSLLIHQRIKTTRVKAKAAQRLADRLITLGKSGTLHDRRRAYAVLGDHAMTQRLFNEIAPLFKSRQGGYTRVLHIENRDGDAADMSLLEFVERLEPAAKPAKKSEDKKEKKAAADKIETTPKPKEKAPKKDRAEDKPAKEAKKEAKKEKKPEPPEAEEKPAQEAQEAVRIPEEKPEAKKKSFVQNLKGLFRRKDKREK